MATMTTLTEILSSASMWQSEHPVLTYSIPDELLDELRVGQLVAVPYGERVVEGIVWNIIENVDLAEWQALEPDVELRPLHTILDPLPALLPHQITLAQWISEYYLTPLALVAQMMLPPGLMQRSRMVLRLAATDALTDEQIDESMRSTSPQLRALIGLLMAEGELTIAHLKEMLGTKRASEVLKEARTHDLVLQGSELEMPRAHARVKQLVHILADEATLTDWRQQAGELASQYDTTPLAAAFRPTHLDEEDDTRGKRRTALLDPWGLNVPMPAPSKVPLTTAEKESIQAQRQLAALDLLARRVQLHEQWTPNALCKASGMTQGQLQQLVRAGILAIEREEVRRDPLRGHNLPATSPLPLTPDQQHALDCITGSQYDGRPVLLHGVTGSGKTEIYLQAIASVIAQGKQGIILVPEIALTTQAVQRVAGRFPRRVAIIHSELGLGERYDEWRRIRAGEVDVVIGSRSALFAPLPKLGIIVVDEEHEPAYKQSERRPTYHAREAALRLGSALHIPVVLGSATPAVETFFLATQGAYRLVELTGRINATLPPVEIIDLRDELHAGNTSIISRHLHEALTLVLERKQQAILFLNRRGMASCVLCRDCGYTVLCDRCDIPMTYHATERRLLCHYCGRHSQILQFCPSCKSSGLRYFGLGTEKVQATIEQLFPQARLLRWDRDTARNRFAHEQLLNQFANREADILIGTQMIAKGLDLPGVTLVGVISADTALTLPDYSVTERAFTLLTQVAGRAGRGKDAGQVIIQTFNPQHFCVETASRHAYHEFYATEIVTRQEYAYPPFRRFAKFTYSHENRYRCQNEALQLYEHLNEWISRLSLDDTDIVGPAPALLERIRGKYHWQMIVRGPDLHRLLRVIEAPGWSIDIDPVSSL